MRRNPVYNPPPQQPVISTSTVLEKTMTCRGEAGAVIEMTWDMVRLPDFGHTLLTCLARIDDGNDPIDDQPNQRANNDKSMFNRRGEATR